MIFSCDQCETTFSFLNNMYRHKKKSCKNAPKPHLNPVGPHLNPVGPPLNPVGPHLNPVGPPITLFSPHQFYIVDKTYVKCMKCEKQITKGNAARHLKACKGCPSNKCRQCGKYFKTNANISRHEKTCNNLSNTIININKIEPNIVTNNITTNVIVNNNIINNNNNFVLNIFGVESWDYLIEICEDNKKNEFDKLKKQLLTEGVDGLCKLIEGHYFNKNFPQNQTIRKPIKNNDFVEVHVGNNEWEPKTLDTAMEEIKNTTSMYIRPILDDVLKTTYHKDSHMKQFLNKTFIDVLVPMRYDICDEYTKRLNDMDVPASHIMQQNEQINRRKIKTMLFEFSNRLIKLSQQL